jgi:carboxypeptidase Taq
LSVAVDSPPLERLKAVLGELDDLRHAESVLDWDSRVFMPRQGASARADATATMTRLIHERFVSDEIGELLDELAPLERERGHDSAEGALIRLTRREWERARRVPPELTGEMSHAAGIAVAAWDEAKAASDFPSFVPHLERMLELKQRYIACFPPTAEPYDVLLDEYEEGMTTAEVTRVFDRLKPELVRLVEERRGDADDESFLHGPFPADGQRQAGRRVLEAFGFTDESWRLDETPHPFAQKPGSGDIRLTTHTNESDLTSLFSTMHEFGHGIYELCVDPALARTPLGTGASAALHESQSRTWENLVGRSEGFWRWFYPELQAIFPSPLRGVDRDRFVQAVNAVRPGPVRGDADEVTYGLHIILRFELELQLLAGTVAPRDLPEAWNAAMKNYLGVDVPDDAHGVLQDTHWAIGLLGYFPTYQLGNVISIQIWERALADLGDVEEQFARGEFAPLREWLHAHVYRYGSMYPPRELLRRVTGTDLDPEPYLAYLNAKFA